MEHTTLIYLLGSAIFFAAFFIRAVSGIGSALLSIPLLALLLEVKVVVPLEAIFEVGFSLLLVKSLYKDMQKKMILYLMIGSALGSLGGVFLLKSVSNLVLQKALGVTVVVFALSLLRNQGQAGHKLSDYWGVVAGVVGGTLGGLFGISGPPMGWYLAYRLRAKDVLRATLIGLFALDFSWRVGIYAFSGMISLEVLKLALIFLPALVLGTLAGNKAQARISDLRFRQIVALILACSGVLLLLK